MSLKRKRSVLSIKDKQSIIVRLEKGEKGTNLSVEYGVSNSEAVECFKRCLSWMERQNNVDAIQIMQLRRSWVLLFINIHIFDYPDPRLSGLFRLVPTSPENRGSTVYIY